ncbi:MAG: hypothetical protein RL660_1083 [Bacteroidota bacterium]|jgi:hypothetical protein
MKKLSVLLLFCAASFMVASCGSKGAKPDAVAKDWMNKRADGDIAAAKTMCTGDAASALDLDAAMLAGMPDSMKAKTKAQDWEVSGAATESGNTASVVLKEKASGDTKTISLTKEGEKWMVSSMQ